MNQRTHEHIGTMSFTIDVHHHILSDVFWRATNDAHNPVGGIVPAPWSVIRAAGGARADREGKRLSPTLTVGVTP
jgi:hypothetical protein